ncbi:M36 family metallopeptidase [Saccharomonospora halophila]|uniref:M36 family metallopeptidase n=1 Tax=Saccharomonospora halophila TaxID=129922 RepID=UPI000381EA43|nr:M36 family metallopeptidase [Saccharomonospora halophila]
MGASPPEHDAAYDVRRDTSVQPSRAQRTAAADLTREVGNGTRVTWDSRFGTPRSIRRPGGWLTTPSDADAESVARSFLHDNRALFGFSAEHIDALDVTSTHELPGTGTHVVTFTQTFDGVPAVRGGHLGVAVSSDGRVLSYSGAAARATSLTGSHELTAADALELTAAEFAPEVTFTPERAGERAGFDVFARGPFGGESYVRRAAFPTDTGAVPAYQVLFVSASNAAWQTVVDAGTSEILHRASLVAHDSEGTVYENHPGADEGGQPVIKPFGPTEQSPSGYVDPTGVAGVSGPTTAGNNANAYANYSNFIAPADQAPRPVSPTAQFNYSYAENWARSEGRTTPPSYAQDLDPAATNLFWHHNRIHDEFYELGFTETAGNFQVDNHGRGGKAGDPILGLVHAGAVSGGAPTYTGRDNAYMLTLPDGLPPWSGMFLWEPINDAFEGPYSDGNFDAGVIEHEYAHGLSNRYVSGEDNALNTHQSGSMGEGWGDWYALNYLYGNGLAERPVVGEYVTGNADRGIRNWDYDTNPTTFADIGYDLGGAEVHSDGEIWTATLWDMRTALVDEYGEAEGGEIAARIVTDAMPLSPPDPSFVDMRDAIRSALDNRYHSRTDYATIVDLVFGAFASRGLGVHASTKSGSDTDPVPSFAHVNPVHNGSVSGRVVNASTGEPIPDAEVIVGRFEARVSPLRVTSETGAFSAPLVDGTYPITITAPGFGARTFSDISVSAGHDTGLRFSLDPNLSSMANGATVVSATAANAGDLLDDTEASTWKAAPGTGNVTVELAQPAQVSRVRVSAYTTSRFEGLRGFTVQTSEDGVNWRTALTEPDGFGYQAPRPTAPDLHYRDFAVNSERHTKYVRFWADSAQGETKDQVQAAEFQVFSGSSTGVEPLPPTPPDEPVTDEGTIAAGNPSTGLTPTGATANAFISACTAPPPGQGADGWVTALPAGFGDGAHRVKVRGDSATPYDLDLYFFDQNCEPTGSAASASADESTTVPSGTRYVLTQLWLGTAVPITLTATDTA